MGGIPEKFDSGNQSINLKLLILTALMAIYGVITLPIYFVIQRPWKVWKENKIVWAKHKKEGDLYSPVQWIPKESELSPEGISNMDELFRKAVSKHGSKKCQAVREVLDEIEESDKTGKVIKKVRLGDFHWYDYIETNQSVETLFKGLQALGLKSKQKIVIFAETRREWFLVLQACFRANIIVATVYAILGKDGIIHCLNELETPTIITSQDLLPKLKEIAGKIPIITKVIYMEDLKPADTSGFPSKMSIFKLSEIEQMGENYETVTECQPAGPNDVAVIMYTSGSTGIPKGVLISHRNILGMVISIENISHGMLRNDVSAWYLPLAHIYEMVIELASFYICIPGGYSSATTLTDISPGLMDGCKGDISLLKPTILCTVPLVLDRMRKGVCEAVAAKGPFVKEFFDYAIKYKAFWVEKGFQTPILNKLLFRKIQERFGGRLRTILCSGAHLSLDTEIFIKACLGVSLNQCYGITEMTAAGTATRKKDNYMGQTGAPYSACTIKLVDWEEGGYKATDKPHPRGEIVIGGECVTLGYFKNEKLTSEVFKEEDGERWYYSGDIGELFPTGTLKIIDRKKDLHKLPHGEYVSLGNVEAEIKTSPLIENMCVIGSLHHAYLIALITPNEKQLRKLATTQGKEEWTLRELCQDHELTNSVTDILQNHGRKNGLLKREIPQKIKLCFEEWTPEMGLLTAALKIKRKALEIFYKEVITELFAEDTLLN